MAITARGQHVSSGRGMVQKAHRPLSSQARPDVTASPTTRCPAARAFTTCGQFQ